MGPEMVTKCQVLADIRMALRKHVGVDDRAAVNDLVEVTAAGDSVLAAIPVPQLPHLVDSLGAFDGAACDRNNVQDRLGRLPGHGRTADMVYGRDPRTTRLQHQFSFSLENPEPHRVVSNNPHLRAPGAQRPPKVGLSHLQTYFVSNRAEVDRPLRQTTLRSK